MNALVYVDIDRGIHMVKLKNALIEKRKKLHGFSFSINVANFEAFCRTKKLISNLFFLKSVMAAFGDIILLHQQNMHSSTLFTISKYILVVLRFSAFECTVISQIVYNIT